MDTEKLEAYISGIDSGALLETVKTGELEELEIFGAGVAQLIAENEISVRDASMLFATASRRAYQLARELKTQPEKQEERQELRKLGKQYRKFAIKSAIRWSV